jgi:hypothetical protein
MALLVCGPRLRKPFRELMVVLGKKRSRRSGYKLFVRKLWLCDGVFVPLIRIWSGFVESRVRLWFRRCA